MGRAFQIGDKVCLSVTGLCEIHSLEHGRPAPLHTGVVIGVGFVPSDDVIVDFGDNGTPCGRDWLLLLTTMDGTPWHST